MTKCTKISYPDEKIDPQELRAKDKGVTIHFKNVRALAVEMFKVSNDYSISLMSEIFDKGNNVYDFRNTSDEVSSMVQKAFLFLALIIVPSELNN